MVRNLHSSIRNNLAVPLMYSLFECVQILLNFVNTLKAIAHFHDKNKPKGSGLLTFWTQVGLDYFKEILKLAFLS